MNNHPEKHNLPDRGGDETYILPINASDPMKVIFERFMSHHTPFGFEKSAADLTYHPMPYRPDDDDPLMLKQPWRIILELYTDDQRMMMGLDLHGDVILGRGPSRPGRIIIDLEPYGAQKLGVSREHLMLRPTELRLFAIDQGSTNGTTVNGAASGRGVATALKNEDLLGLGNMVIMLRIVERPDRARKLAP